MIRRCGESIKKINWSVHDYYYCCPVFLEFLCCNYMELTIIHSLLLLLAGVRLPHSIIMNRLEWQWQQFPYSSTETHGIFKTALTFVDHVSEVWGPLLNGASLVCVPREVTKNPEMLIPLLEKFEVDFIIQSSCHSRLIFIHPSYLSSLP